ncbi:hypothetical protein COT42_04965 [Candidatus Saganbacteria bacterium CG08_land_8_20_14_0_20_45_16]|uniref:Uncharacterized protein n=1 Tax=Candidatus Saganbacteria bacterium CG08_land_8_20_14_0_20_45_16 TaxID=2014293 RepID=A0A2H0XZQ0_UNCSA|nr:MAG: hypothetical protein COT42_04965 [Candidatus Saganbacteria bacterium CG08_land_8_20_14_0_20_45_16]
MCVHGSGQSVFDWLRQAKPIPVGKYMFPGGSQMSADVFSLLKVLISDRAQVEAILNQQTEFLIM